MPNNIIYVTVMRYLLAGRDDIIFSVFYIDV